MMDNKLETVIKKILNQSNYSLKNNGDEALKNYGLDSMGAINLLFELEEEFDIAIPDEYLMEESFSSGNKLKTMLLNIQSN